MPYGGKTSDRDQDWASYAESETVRVLSEALERMLAQKEEAETPPPAPDPGYDLVVQDTPDLPVVLVPRVVETDEGVHGNMMGVATPIDVVEMTDDEKFEAIVEPIALELGDEYLWDLTAEFGLRDDNPPLLRTIDLDAIERPTKMKLERPVKEKANIGEYRSGPRLIRLHLDNV